MGILWSDIGAAEAVESDGPVPERVEVAVVGAGFTGLSAAYYLAAAGAEVAVLEQSELAFGASGRNGGQLLAGWPANMAWIQARYGKERAQALWQISTDALDRVRGLVATHHIRCDLRPLGHVDTALDDAARRELEEEWRVLTVLDPSGERILWDAAQTRDRLGVDRYAGGLFDPAAYAFQPRAYALGLAQSARKRGARLHTGVEVTDVVRHHGRYRIQLAQGTTLDAGAVVLATNAYVPQWAPWLKARILPVRSAQVAVRLASPGDLPSDMPSVADTGGDYHYYRRVGDGILVFGGRATRAELRRGTFPSLAARLRTWFPALTNATVTHQWSGLIAIASDFIPHLVRLPNGVWAAAGYTGHGAALSTEMGWLVAQALVQSYPDPAVALLQDLPWQPWPLRKSLGFALHRRRS